MKGFQGKTIFGKVWPISDAKATSTPTSVVQSSLTYFWLLQ